MSCPIADREFEVDSIVVKSGQLGSNLGHWTGLHEIGYDRKLLGNLCRLLKRLTWT